MESNHRVDEGGEGSSNRNLTDYELNINEINPLSSHGSSDSYSSSTSSSNDEDLFDFDGNNDTNDRIEKSRPKSRKNPQVPFASTSSANQVYVQNRIPSSVFSIKPGTGLDWSAASSESLFSIQIGNGSFSKDKFIMLYKSGELTKLDEQIIAQKNVLPSLKELDDMAARDENKTRGSGHEASAVQTVEVAEDLNDSKVARTEEVKISVSNGPMENHGTLVENISMEKKPTTEVHSAPISKNPSVDISFTFPVLTAADGGRPSSAYADQNNKGTSAPLSNLQQPPLPQQPPEEEEQREKEITEENEPQNPVSPQNDQSRSLFSWLSCCRRS